MDGKNKPSTPKYNIAGTEKPSNIKFPNKIILILVDALRFDTSRVLWPLFNIIFTQHYTSSTWTLPTTTRLLTGVIDNGNNYLKKVIIENIYEELKGKMKVPTIGKYLKDNGWITFGKTEGLYLSPTFGFGRESEWDLWWVESKADGSNLLEPKFVDDKKEFRFYHDYYIHNYFEDRKRSREETKSNVVPGEAVEVYLWEGLDELEEMEQHYWRRCAGLPKLLSWVPHSDAMVIVTADPGEAFLEFYGDFAHTESHMVDEVAKVPLLIHWPGMERQRIGMFTRDIDVAPTILEMAGINPTKIDNPKLSGKSLVPVITEGKMWASVYSDFYVHRSGEMWQFFFSPTEKRLHFIKELKPEKKTTKETKKSKK